MAPIDPIATLSAVQCGAVQSLSLAPSGMSLSCCLPPWQHSALHRQETGIDSLPTATASLQHLACHHATNQIQRAPSPLLTSSPSPSLPPAYPPLLACHHAITRRFPSLPPQVTTPEDLLAADRLVFPGVGAFASAMKVLRETG